MFQTTLFTLGQGSRIYFLHLSLCLCLSLSPPGFSSPFIKQRLANSKAHTSRFISANLPCNKFKNRLVNIMPFESTRVCLQPIRGVEGSDYINASCIDGYRSAEDSFFPSRIATAELQVLTFSFREDAVICVFIHLEPKEKTRSDKPFVHFPRLSLNRPFDSHSITGQLIFMVVCWYFCSKTVCACVCSECIPC